MSKMMMSSLQVGALGTNCYLVRNTETNELLIIDPGAQADRVSRAIEKTGCVPKAILLTHGHFDHIGAVEGLRYIYRISAYILEEEADLAADSHVNLSNSFGISMRLEADETLKDGQILELAGFRIKVLHTPGHTKGSASFYFEEEGKIFSGDTLFNQSVGRTDFPTGSMSELVRGIHEKLFTLPDETIVYPGHGEETTVGFEKQYNFVAAGYGSGTSDI